MSLSPSLAQFGRQLRPRRQPHSAPIHAAPHSVAAPPSQRSAPALRVCAAGQLDASPALQVAHCPPGANSRKLLTTPASCLLHVMHLPFYRSRRMWAFTPSPFRCSARSTAACTCASALPAAAPQILPPSTRPPYTPPRLRTRGLRLFAPGRGNAAAAPQKNTTSSQLREQRSQLCDFCSQLFDHCSSV